MTLPAETNEIAAPYPTDPIGVFDSGVGGLTVWREIVRQLPAESTVYLADQARVPYGSKSIEEIRYLSRAISDFLIGQRAKVIVIACNTASGAALHWLRSQYPQIPFVGMEPAVKPAAEHTKNGRVGVLATPTTYQGDLYHALIARFASGVSIHSQTCPGLVELIEKGQINSLATVRLLRTCLKPLKGADIDQLVLACTHYPFVSHLIQAEMGATVEVIDPAPAIARQVERVLQVQQLRAPSTDEPMHIMYTSGDVKTFHSVIRQLLRRILDCRQVKWEGDRLVNVVCAS